MTEHRGGTQHSDLWSLLRAIAARDANGVRTLLAEHPRLAATAMANGATRAEATQYFLTDIERHVYAGDTPLHVAAAAYDADLASRLVRLGADSRAKNRRGAEPLHAAATGGPGAKQWNPQAQIETIEQLIRDGADPDATDNDGVTPLHRAVRSRCADAVRVLLVHGADVRRKNGHGSTPLHLAVQNTGRGGTGSLEARLQQAEIVRILVDHGARMADRDGRGRTVIDCISPERLASLASLPT